MAGKPRRALYVGDQHDLEWITPLGLELVADAKEASFVLLTSIDERTDPIGAYLPALTRALDLNLPLLCANPDRSVLIAGELRMGSGTLADLYADLGGTVLWFGKPHPAVYELAVEHLRGLGKTRICALGDALETDIKGALDQGLAAALVPGGGVHRLELGTGFGELPDTEAMEALLARHGVRPDFLLAALR